VKVAKWAALAIAGSLAFASRAAMRQEDAIFGLVAALKVAGEYTPQVTKRLTDFASAMQKITIFGDEATIEQMAYASALGVSADKMEEAMKAAMGLAVITKSLETATMLVARAAGGQTSMLTRYGIMLDETLSPQEKFNALLKKGAELFDLATAKAETTSGALKQMWNAIGDVAEVIGAALLPGIKAAGTSIKEWSERNQEQIGRWAEIVVAHITFVKDIFTSFVLYLVGDWMSGLSFTLNIAIELFRGFGNALVATVDYAIDKIIATTGTKLIGGLTDKIDWAIAYMQKKWEMGILYMTASQKKAARAYADEIVAGMRKTRSMQGELAVEPLSGRLKKVTSGVAQSIEELTPPEMAQNWDAALSVLQDRLAGIDKGAEAATKTLEGLSSVGKQAQAEIVAIEMLLAENAQQIAANNVKLAEEAAKKISSARLKWAQESIDQIRSLDMKTHTERLQLMDELMERKHEDWAETSEAMALLAEERKRYADQHKEGWEAVRQTMSIWFQDASNWGKNLGNILTNAFDRAADSFADMLMKQKVDWKAFGVMFIKELIAMIIKLQMAIILQAILEKRAPNIPSGPIGPTASGGNIQQAAEGGHVAESGLAVIHKGEDIIPAGGSGLTVNVIDNVGVGVAVEENQDERTYSVILTALSGDGPLRRAVKQAAR